MVAGANVKSFLKLTKDGHPKKRSDAKMREEIEKFDNAFPDGVFAFPGGTKTPKIKVRALDEYCTKHGIQPKDVDKEKMKEFLVYQED